MRMCVPTLACVAAIASHASAQTSHTIVLGDLGTVPATSNPILLQTGGSGFPLATGTSLSYTTAPGVINAAEAYTVEFVPFITAVGTFLEPFTDDVEGNPMLPPGTVFPLRGILDSDPAFIANVGEYLFDGVISNPGAGLPSPTLSRKTFLSNRPELGSTQEFEWVYTVTVNADRSITVTFEDISFLNTAFGIPTGPLTIVNNPFVAFIDLGNGPVFFGDSTMTISTTTLPAADPPTATEFRFDGDLKQAYGPAEIAYLDDPKFADKPGPEDGDPVLQGPLSNVIASPQYGFTEAQSSFGTTTSFGIPDINGQEATVFDMTEPRIAPGPYQNDRQVGLAVAPLTGADYPGSINNVDRFTMIWDIYVPAASWNTQTPVSFINFQQDNGTNSDQQQSADFRITSFDGTAGGAKGIGINRLRVNGEIFDAASIVGADFGPDRWMRVALVVDNQFALEAKVFINGTLVGFLGWADEVENYIDPANPLWRSEDLDQDGSFNFFTPMDTATFVGWDNFPNPWHDNVVTQTSPTRQTPDTRSNMVMFGDALGQGEQLYVANYHFAQFVMNDAEIAALGGPNADGIVIVCPLDTDNNGLTVTDVTNFVGEVNNGTDAGNYNRDSETDTIDLLDKLNTADETGC